MNFVLVTGASTGLGEQICKCLASHQYSVLAGVRNAQDGERLVAQVGKTVHPLLLDVTDEAMINTAKEAATAIIGDQSLVAIINNAGIVISGASLYIPVAEWQKQFDVNLFGAIRVTNTFFPLLVKKNDSADAHPRRIINMSSVSGLFASPFMGPYASSKYALEGMSDSLRRELYMYDVQVVLLEPASIRTPIWTKAKEYTPWFGPEYESIRTFKEKIIDRNVEGGMNADMLDSYIMKAVRSRKVKPRYLVHKQKWKFNLVRWLPAQWVDRMIRKRLQAGANIRPF